MPQIFPKGRKPSGISPDLSQTITHFPSNANMTLYKKAGVHTKTPKPERPPRS